MTDRWRTGTPTGKAADHDEPAPRWSAPHLEIAPGESTAPGLPPVGPRGNGPVPAWLAPGPWQQGSADPAGRPVSNAVPTPPGPAVAARPSPHPATRRPAGPYSQAPYPQPPHPPAPHPPHGAVPPPLPRHTDAVATPLDHRSIVRYDGDRPVHGWRGRVYSATGGRLNPGLSPSS